MHSLPGHLLFRGINGVLIRLDCGRIQHLSDSFPGKPLISFHANEMVKDICI